MGRLLEEDVRKGWKKEAGEVVAGEGEEEEEEGVAKEEKVAKVAEEAEEAEKEVDEGYMELDEEKKEGEGAQRKEGGKKKRKRKKKEKEKEKLSAGVTIKPIGDGYPEGFPDERKAPEDRKGKGVEVEGKLGGVERLILLKGNAEKWEYWLVMNRELSGNGGWKKLSGEEKLDFFERAYEEQIGDESDEFDWGSGSEELDFFERAYEEQIWDESDEVNWGSRSDDEDFLSACGLLYR